MRKTLLIITAVMLVIGCSKPINDETLIDVDGLKYHPETKELYSGDVFKNYLGGKTEYEGSYKNGKQDGKWTEWYETGQKKGEGTYKDGTLTGFSEYELSYVTVKDLKGIDIRKPGKRVKMGGTIVDGSRQEVAEGWRFELAQDELTIPVLYYELTVPDMFHNKRVEVIVEGIYEQGEFHADNLMTKCASRYGGKIEEEKY
jgi:cytochrome c-type biogenesis protein CcmE